MSSVLNSVEARVTAEMNEQLLLPYEDEEIKAALFHMHPSKSPGPDGASLENANLTHLCLIPKIKEPKEASHFRPIALCNVLNRIASKVVANRLKRLLPDIISPLQSAYVPGRLISDDTLIATEVAHFMHGLRKQQGFFSLKLDISKAYDRLEWHFLEAMLLKLGFAQAWVTQIMLGVTSVQYSILLNGAH
ncbi:hypothetical protein ACLB2K_013847 [Fragaria x ananassa]